MFDIPASDWLWILLLGSICTAFAFVASVKVMEELTPFTVSLTINLEPVYGIILAFFIFGSSEKMTFGFYVGTVLILGALYLNALKKKGKLPFRKAALREKTND
jgi:drug/metabolite transporter (DMT)-like permease